MAAATAADWELFADWCSSMDVESLPTTPETLGAFLAAFPAALSTQGRRVWAVRRAHEAAGLPLDLPRAPVASVVRVGGSWADIPRALSQVAKFQFPIGLRGRRDAWLLVLVGTLGLSREAARAIVQQDVELLGRISVRGVPIPRAEGPAECEACAVTRWLRVIGAAHAGLRSDVRNVLLPTVDADAVHDCAVGLDGTWRSAAVLLPSIDRHGWLALSPMSTRAISETVKTRLALGEVAVAGFRAPSKPGRFANATMSELADARDDADARAAAMLLRLNAILGDSLEMLEELKEIGTG